MISARRALSRDVDVVAEMWLEAARWLGERGYDQWQYPIKMYNIVAAVEAGHCWLFDDDGRSVGTVTLDDTADLSLWLPEDMPDDALYLHRLVVRRSASARNLGSAIVDWASRQAQAAGKSWLRLDAWSTNADLHAYYESLGFRWVRTVKGAEVVSGVLFQRRVGQVLGHGPEVMTAE